MAKNSGNLPPGGPSTALGRTLVVQDAAYWYDTHRNGLWSVDPVLADVLPVWDGGNDLVVQTLLAARHPAGEVARAIAEIVTARDTEGLFRADRPAARAPSAGLRSPWARELGHLTLALTETCNLRCGYCPQTLHPASRRAMTERTARSAVRFFARRSADAPLRNVSFYGGEPLLQMPLVQAVAEEIASHPWWPPLRLTLDTNATLIDDDVAAWIARTGAHLQVSCDGPAAVHDRYRRTAGREPTHAVVMAGLRRVLRADPAAARRISFVATLGPPFPFAEVAEWFAGFPLYREVGIDHVPVVRINAAAPGGHDPGLAEPERGQTLQKALVDAERAYVEAHLAGRRDTLPTALQAMFDGDLVRWHRRARGPLPPTAFPAGVCRPGVRRLFVAPDGSFLPCERVALDLVIGHVDRGFDFAALGRLNERLLAAVGSACGSCWAQRLCGVCLAVLGPDPQAARRACAGARRRAEAVLLRHLELRRGAPEAFVFLDNVDIF